MSPRFSIVIPVYKVEKYLRQCLDSVLAQSYTDFEIVVVDDGSPDNCPAICDAYATADSRVTVIHKENGGLSDARNAGLLAATGEYVIFMDSDDYYLSTDLFTEIDAKIAETACDAVFFQYRKYIEKSKTLKESPVPYPETMGMSCNEVLLHLSARDMLDASACQKATRRTLFLENGLFFKTRLFSEDVEWFFRYVPQLKSVALLNEPAYCYRIRAGSISHSLTEKNIRDLFSSIEIHADAIRDGDAENKAALLNYMAYQYYIVLGLSHNVLRGSVRRTFFSALRRYRWLADYSISGKTRKCALLVRLLGVRLSGVIMGLYIRIE